MTDILKYYDFKTKTLNIPFDFNKKISYIPKNTKIINFKEDPKKFIILENQEITANLPNTITDLIISNYIYFQFLLIFIYNFIIF